MHDSSSNSDTKTTECPRETEGLPEARHDRAGRAFRRRRVRARDRAREEADRRCDGPDALVQRLRPRPHAEGPAGRDHHRQGRQSRRSRGNRALAWASPREPLRRNARHAGPDPGRRDLHLPGARARSGRLLVPPAHPRGLRPGDGPVRKHPRQPERARLLAAGEPRAAAHPRRHPDRGRKDRCLQRVRDHARGDGPLRQRDARRRRARPQAGGQAGRGRAFLLHQHRQHPRLQRNAAGRADEADRRRRRPLRARRARHEVLLAPSERVVVDVLFPDAGELELQHKTPEHTYRLASISVADEQPEQPLAEEFARLRTNRDMAELRERIEPFFKAPPDKTLSFVAEMDMGVPEGVPVVYVVPNASRGDERGAGQLPQVRHEAACPGGGRDDLRLPDASGGDERQA